MADLTLTVYDVGRTTAAGANFTDNLTAATNADNVYFANDGRVLLVVQSGGGGNVTVTTPNTVDALAITDLVIAAAAGDLQIHGPFPPSIYNDANGKVKVVVSANTNVMAIRV
jgi:hypothetical protein